MPNPRVLIPNWGPGRTTPSDDRHIKGKLEEIEQSKAEKTIIGQIIEDVETILKHVGEKMGTGKTEEERPLQDVVRIGAFPMGTMLKGETNLEMILLTREKETGSSDSIYILNGWLVPRIHRWLLRSYTPACLSGQAIFFN